MDSSRICAHCGTAFTSGHSHKKYCTAKCQNSAHHEREDQVLVTGVCLYCHQEYEAKRKAMYRQRRFCTIKCAKKWHYSSVLKAREHPCEWCGLVFTHVGTSSQRFCGKSCARSHANHAAKKPRELSACPVCGTLFYKRQQKQRTCSVVCGGKFQSREYRATRPVQSRAVREQQAEGRCTSRDLRLIWQEQDGRCAYCDTKLVRREAQKDHIIPLSRGGTNYPWNICYACASCNCSKHDRLLDEWLEARPDLHPRVYQKRLI